MSKFVICDYVYFKGEYEIFFSLQFTKKNSIYTGLVLGMHQHVLQCGRLLFCYLQMPWEEMLGLRSNTFTSFIKSWDTWTIQAHPEQPLSPAWWTLLKVFICKGALSMLFWSPFGISSTSYDIFLTSVWFVIHFQNHNANSNLQIMFWCEKVQVQFLWLRFGLTLFE